MGKFFYENLAHKVNLPKMGKCFYDNFWAIRLIAAQLLTFITHTRPVPSPQLGFGGLSPPKQCTKPHQIEIWKLQISGVMSICKIRRH